MRPKVVIVGGGFGGLFAAKFLRRVDVDVVLIDRNNHHLFQPLLYQVATGILSTGEIAPPLRDVLRKHTNVTVEIGDVTGFDLVNRRVLVDRPVGVAEIEYDQLIVATGVGGSYFGHDEFAVHAPGMKTMDDALALRTKIFGAFEMAVVTDDPAERQAWLTFAVVGGGPTGVEIAGQITELAHRALGAEFRRFDPRTARVMLFEGGDEILATFGHKLSGRATTGMDKIGVEVHTGSRVTAVSADGITVQDATGEQFYPCRTKVWAAGVTAPALAAELAAAAGATTDRAGRIEVLPDCTLPGHPEVFVIGDVMALDDLPGVAEVAMQTGIHAARTIRRRTKGDDEAKPFKYRDLGSMATISRFQAIVDFKGMQFSGFIGWLMWAFVHLTFLTGFKNRIFAGIGWVLSFVGRGRHQRQISWPEAKAALSPSVGEAPPATAPLDQDQHIPSESSP